MRHKKKDFTGVSPPVPAALKVGWQRALDLGVDDNDVVGLGPLVQANVLDILLLDVSEGLLATVVGDLLSSQRRIGSTPNE